VYRPVSLLFHRIGVDSGTVSMLGTHPKIRLETSLIRSKNLAAKVCRAMLINGSSGGKRPACCCGQHRPRRGQL